MDSEQTSEATKIDPARFLNWIERPSVVVATLAFMAVLLVWANVARPFYTIDDDNHLKLATQDTIAEAFAFEQESTLLPISHLSLRLDRMLFGPPMSEAIFKLEGRSGRPIDSQKFYANTTWSGGTRAMNALYHVAAGFLLWWFLRRMGTSSGIAFLVAAVWVGHPMACESVCWISERKNVLAALFGFATLVAWSAGNVGWRWPVVTVLYALAALSKPTAIGLLPVLIVLEILAATRRESWRDRLVSAAGLLAPIAVTILIVNVNMKIHSIFFVEPPGGSVWTAVLTDSEIFARYAFNILVPVNLSFFYGVVPIVSLGDFRLWLYGGMLLALLAFPIWVTKGAARERAILGVIWFLAALGPTSNIASIPYWMQDRYAYVSAAGLLLAIFEGVHALLERREKRDAVLPVGLGMGFVLFIALLSTLRSPMFGDAETLFVDAATMQPNSGMAQIQAWEVYRDRATKLARSTNPADRPAVEENARLAVRCFERGINCADLTNVREAFEFRARTAELALTLLRNPQKAFELLNGSLPPANLKMRDTSRPIVAADMKYSYEPHTLAFAWLTMADIRVGRAGLDGLTLEQRYVECDEALKALDKSVAIQERKIQYAVLKAKILIVQSKIDNAAKKPDEAAKRLETAKTLLMSVPATAKSYRQAQDLLTEIPRK